jgi:hypothetical protein
MVEVQNYDVNALLSSFSLDQQWAGIIYIVGFRWLHHMPSLADVTMEIGLNEVKSY